MSLLYNQADKVCAILWRVNMGLETTLKSITELQNEFEDEVQK